MIRLAEPRDAQQIAEIYRPFCEDNCISFETEAPDGSEIAARIEKIRQRFPWLVKVDGPTIAGYAYASSHRERPAYRWGVEVTIYIHGDFRGKGIGRALYTELFDRLRAQGFFKAYAGIVIPNPPSQAFHESMGFTRTATYPGVGYKLGAWRDTGWWQLALQPEIDSPADPKPPSSRNPAP